MKVLQKYSSETETARVFVNLEYNEESVNYSDATVSPPFYILYIASYEYNPLWWKRTGKGMDPKKYRRKKYTNIRFEIDQEKDIEQAFNRAVANIEKDPLYFFKNTGEML